LRPGQNQMQKKKEKKDRTKKKGGRDPGADMFVSTLVAIGGEKGD